MPFDNAKHPRDGVGRFASDGAAPSMRTATHTQEPRRSLTRNSRVWSIGARTQELPSSYTGSVTKEHEVGTFLHHKLTAQIPKSVGVEDWSTLMRRLYTTIVEHRTPTIDRALATRTVRMPNGRTKEIVWKDKPDEPGRVAPAGKPMIPDGTPRGTLLRAYRHASHLALHDFGTVDYDFRMDPHLRDEMKPLTNFIRYARNRVADHLFTAAPGEWKPFRKEFGQPFSDQRRDMRPWSEEYGQVRRRTRPNEVLVKRNGGFAKCSTMQKTHITLSKGANTAQRAKIKLTMHEFKHGKLRSGSKTGPKVKNRRQAIAIALSQARRAG